MQIIYRNQSQERIFQFYGLVDQTDTIHLGHDVEYAGEAIACVRASLLPTHPYLQPATPRSKAVFRHLTLSIGANHMPAHIQQRVSSCLTAQVPKGYPQSQRACLHGQHARQLVGLRAGRLQSVATDGTAVQVDADAISENDRLLYERLAQEVAVRCRTHHAFHLVSLVGFDLSMQALYTKFLLLRRLRLRQQLAAILKRRRRLLPPAAMERSRRGPGRGWEGVLLTMAFHLQTCPRCGVSICMPACLWRCCILIKFPAISRRTQ